MIFFEPLKLQHLPLIHRWFNTPHVQQFYSLRSWTEEEVYTKLLPLIEHQVSLKGYIIRKDTRPLGYIQCYPVKDYPWDGLCIPEDILANAAGLDLFIGEEEYLGKKLGTAILSRFIQEHIWNSYTFCFADPNQANAASVRLFENAGFLLFKPIETHDALGNAATLRIMFLQRKKS